MLDFTVYIIATITIWIVYCCVKIIYNLYFHPLATIPGPRLAAATQWYELYYDLLRWPGGQYWYEIDKMHERYGPIVRVTPYEVHVQDCGFYDQLYCNATEGARDKYPPSAHMTGTPEGIFGTVDHRVHRSRRAAISGFFSKRAVQDIEPWIHERCRTLCETIRRQQRENGSVELRVNFLALTTDVIAAHSLNGSNPHNTLHLLKNDENAREWQRSIAALAFLTPLVKQFPWLIPMALKLPVKLWMSTLPSLGRVVRLNRDMRSSAKSAIDEYSVMESAPVEKKESLTENSTDGGTVPRLMTGSTATARHNIFHTILKSNLPPVEKTPKRLGQEGFVAIAAGGETCGRMLTNGVYYTMTAANRDRVWPHLKEELWQAMPQLQDADAPDLKTLEQLPFLTAVIKETLRLSALLTSRLPLVAPYQALVYTNTPSAASPSNESSSSPEPKTYVIPPGCAVSMSLRDILHNESIFPGPLEFWPERWLSDEDENSNTRSDKSITEDRSNEKKQDEAPKQGQRKYLGDIEQMNKWYVPFSRGTRNCIGINLAYAQLYIVLASLFRRYEIDVDGLTRDDRDVQATRDCFIGEPRLDSPGVQVFVKERES